MKITYLHVTNVGLIEDQKIELNQPLILLYGEIRQGKTTFLNAVRWVCGGAFPTDIIRHGQDEAAIELGFEGGMIRREFYRSKKTSETMARDVVFVRDGRPVARPVGEIKKFLNPFLLDQNHLANMGEAERKQFFVDLFGVDTKQLDTEAFNNGQEASRLRSKLEGYGTIDLTPQERVDATELRQQLANIRTEHQNKKDAWDRDCENYNKLVNARSEALAEVTRLTIRVGELEAQLQDTKNALQAAKDRTAEPLPAEPIEPPAPDTKELETKIENAAAQNVRAEQYESNKTRADARKADQDRLNALETRGREIKAERVAKLAKISKESGVPGLRFEEDGSFSFDGTQAGMLSTSQIMELSSRLSELYPEGFGLELLDRGESLGKSIFDFIDRAKAEDLTILATVVGEAPAKVPADVGVFVVEKGKAKRKPKDEPKTEEPKPE